MKRLYPDSNVFLQYRYQEIDWRALAGGVDEVELVVVAEAFREIEKYKDEGSPRLQKRARAASAWITMVVRNQGGVVRPGVRLVLDVKDPTRGEIEALGLNPDVSDDKILVSILKDDGGHNRIFVTADNLRTFKAEAHGLKFGLPPDDKKQADEPDPREERLRQLEKQLDVRPKLSFGFEGGKDNASSKLFVFETYEGRQDDFEAHLDEMIEEERPFIGKSTLTAAIMAGSMKTPPSEDAQARYLAKLRAYLTEHHDNIVRSRLKFTVSLEFRNENENGGSAEDIEVVLTVPPPVYLAQPTTVEVPDPPERPKWRSILAAHVWPLADEIDRTGRVTAADLFEAQNMDGRLFTDRKEPYVAWLRLRELKHSSEHTIILPMWFEDADAALTANGFAITYTVHPKNAPVLEGELHVRLDIVKRPLSVHDLKGK